MNIYYSQTGFPMALKWTEETGRKAMDIYNRFINSSGAGFDVRLSLVEEAIELLLPIGDLYDIVLTTPVKLTPTVRSLIIQHADIICNNKKMSSIAIDDWMLLLEPSDVVFQQEPNWTDDEKELLEEVHGITNQIQGYANSQYGINKFFELLKLRLMEIE